MASAVGWGGPVCSAASSSAIDTLQLRVGVDLPSFSPDRTHLNSGNPVLRGHRQFIDEAKKRACPSHSTICNTVTRTAPAVLSPHP
jgi:hypothetical protein